MFRAPMSRARSTRRGMVIAQVVLSLSVLMAMLAVVVDGGLLLVERRHAQATADAAALAAASDIYAKNGSTGTAAASALGVASNNGYTNDGTHSSVTVNIPPVAGNFIGKAGYAEVIVTWQQQRVFSVGLGNGTIPVSARAVAQGRSVSGASGLPGILLLNPSGTGITVKGNGTIDVTDPKGYTGSGGSIYVDSLGPGAVVTTGNASVSAPTVYIAQTGSAPSGVTATTGDSGMHTGAAQLPDPLSYLPSPVTNPPPGTNVVSLPNGISLQSNDSMTLTSNTVYILGGSGISLQGNATLTGSNVMIYLTGTASINLNGNGAVNLSPMTSGPYQGITFFQDRNDSSTATLTGNGALNITGTIYAPAANVTAVGNGTSDNFGSQILANTMTTKGNGTVNVAFDANSKAVPSIRNFGLVE